MAGSSCCLSSSVSSASANSSFTSMALRAESHTSNCSPSYSYVEQKRPLTALLCVVRLLLIRHHIL